MTKLIKRVIPSLLLVAIMGLVSCYGCSSYTPSTMPWTGISPENLTQQQWQDILTVALEYQAHLDTYKLAVMTTVSTDAAGGQNPWKLSLNTALSGFKNIKENQKQISNSKSMAMNGLGQNGEVQNAYYDTFALGDWMYVNMANPNGGVIWIKIKNSSNLEDYFSYSIADQQMSLVNSPTDIKYVKTEQVHGVDCYVLSITLNKSELATWLSQQDIGLNEPDWQNIVSDVNAIKEINCTYYVARDSYRVMRMYLSTTIELTPEQANLGSNNIEKVTLNLSMDTILYDQNVLNTISLPAEANMAIERSSSIFLD